MKQIHHTLNQNSVHPPECYMWHNKWCFTPPDTGQLLVELLHQGLGVAELGLQRALSPGPAAAEQMGWPFFGRGQQRHHQWGSLINYTAEGRALLGRSEGKARGAGIFKDVINLLCINTLWKHANVKKRDKDVVAKIWEYSRWKLSNGN